MEATHKYKGVIVMIKMSKIFLCLNLLLSMSNGLLAEAVSTEASGDEGELQINIANKEYLMGKIFLF